MKGTRVPRKIVANLLPSFSISSSIHIVIDYRCARYLHGGFRSLVWEVQLAWQIWQLCFEKESFAVRKKVLPWERVFCREKECFAVRKSVLPWERKFCREKESFAVTLVGHRIVGHRRIGTSMWHTTFLTRERVDKPANSAKVGLYCVWCIITLRFCKGVGGLKYFEINTQVPF